MKTLRLVLLLAAKDLRIEARTRSTLAQAMALGVLIVSVLALGIGAGLSFGSEAPVQKAGAEGAQATAALWVAYLFVGVLIFERTMTSERSDDALLALLLAPVDRGVLYLGKTLAILVMASLVTVAILAAGIVLLRLELRGMIMEYLAVTTFGLIGFSAVGTMFSAAASSSKPRSGLLALLALPLSMPIVLISTRLAMRLGEEGGEFWRGLGILAAFDVVFLVAGWNGYELLLEA